MLILVYIGAERHPDGFPRRFIDSARPVLPPHPRGGHWHLMGQVQIAHDELRPAALAAIQGQGFYLLEALAEPTSAGGWHGDDLAASNIPALAAGMG